jgi:hypothetical protein
MNEFGFAPFPDFKLKFKISILAFLNSNLNSKLQIFNLAVTYEEDSTKQTNKTKSPFLK